MTQETVPRAYWTRRVGKGKKEYEKQKAESHQAKDIIIGTLATAAGYMLYQGIKRAITWGVAGASGGIGLALGFAF